MISKSTAADIHTHNDVPSCPWPLMVAEMTVDDNDGETASQTYSKINQFNLSTSF